MSKNPKYNIALTVKDHASSGIKKAVAEMQKGETKMAQSHKRFSEARKNLSINSDKEIQREIQRTEASYNRLARAGFKSANEQQRAYQAMTSRVKELNSEMNKTNKIGSTLKNLGKIGGGLVAGATVSYNIAKEPIMKYMDYEERLAYTANTAFDDRDAAGRIAGVEDLKGLVKTTVQYGGTKEDVIAGINALLAPGELDFSQVENLAPIIQKTAVATQSSTEEISKIVMAMLTNFDIAISEIPLALDMALKAGESGSFELQDMAGWLSQQLSMGAQRGMSGMDHYKDILVMNQQAARIAGSSDQAGNYIYSFLSAMTDASTIRAFANSDYKEGDKKGIDLAQSMVKGVEAGQSPVEAFMHIMDKFIGGNEDYQKLLKEIEGAEGADKLAKLEQMATLLEGSEVSQILGNKQSLMGYIALRSQGTYGEQVAQALDEALGAVDISHQVVASTTKFRTDGEKTNRELAEMEAYKPVAEAWANIAVTLDQYAAEYPELTKSIIIAKNALFSLGAAAAGMAVLSKLFGKGGGGFDVPWGRPQTTVPSTQSPTGRSPAPASGSGVKSAATLGLRWAPVAGMAYSLYEGSKDDIGTILNKHDGFTPEAAGEITETGYEKTIKPIVDTVSMPFIQAFNSLVNAIPGLRDDPNATIPGVIDVPYQIPTIGQRMDAIANNPDYQPYSIGPEVVQLMERTLETIEQQQNPAQQAPTVIQLQVTGEMDGRQIMEIVEQHTIDMMNRGSKN